jgi:hypothetical protein
LDLLNKTIVGVPISCTLIACTRMGGRGHRQTFSGFNKVGKSVRGGQNVSGF